MVDGDPQANNDNQSETFTPNVLRDEKLPVKDRVKLTVEKFKEGKKKITLLFVEFSKLEGELDELGKEIQIFPQANMYYRELAPDGKEACKKKLVECIKVWDSIVSRYLDIRPKLISDTPPFDGIQSLACDILTKHFARILDEYQLREYNDQLTNPYNEERDESQRLLLQVHRDINIFFEEFPFYSLNAISNLQQKLVVTRNNLRDIYDMLNWEHRRDGTSKLVVPIEFGRVLEFEF